MIHSQWKEQGHQENRTSSSVKPKKDKIQHNIRQLYEVMDP